MPTLTIVTTTTERIPEPAGAPAPGLVFPDPLGAQPGRSGGRFGYLLDALRLRPAGRKVLSVLSVLLFLLGAGMFAYPFFTDLYSAQVIQRPLEDHFESEEFRVAYEAGTLEEGGPLTKIVIPAIGVDALVVSGTSPSALRAGAGHYPSTPLPGMLGNVGIAGHRTTYGKPFNRIDELPVGAEIRLITPVADHRYRVMAHPEGVPGGCPSGACWITNPQDWSVVAPLEGHFLTLTSCHPKGSARQRIILRAELIETTPRASSVAPASG